MTLIISDKITLRNGWQPMDPDAATYITAVETADGQALEEPVKIAIDNFVLGCKADGIWSAIKASCILAGARTLAGALVPLLSSMPAPTPFAFVDADYSRKTGLKGNGSTKYLNSNFADDSVSQNNISFAVYQSTARTASATEALLGVLLTTPSLSISALQAASFGSIAGYCRNSSDNSPFTGTASTAKFIGASRSSSESYVVRTNSTEQTFSMPSAAPTALDFTIFARNNSGTAQFHADARIAFYFIGDSLNLARLDARVTDLINAIGVAIP